MILYGGTLSPVVRKVMAYCGERGIEFELKPGGFGQGGDEFTEASPFEKMPAMRDPGAGEDGGDYLLSDSTAIIAYLEAKRPGSGLMPDDARQRGRVVWFEEYADTMLFPAVVTMFYHRLVAPYLLKRPFDEGAAETAQRETLPPMLDYLERVIPDSLFLVGDRLSVADLSVASLFANLDYIGSGVDAGRYPKIARYVEAILSRPSFAKWIEKDRKLVAKVTG